MKVTSKTRLQYRIQYILFIVLLLGCIGFAGWLSNEYDFRSDWTAGKRHSLSDDTLQLLKQLPLAVELRTYQADDPALTQAINEILQRYQNHKKDFSYQIINPDIYLQQAKEDNINAYGQTIIEYQGKSERIDRLSEESITNALIRLQRNNNPILLFLSQHGERSINDDSAAGYSQLANKLANKGFDVRSINLLQQTLSIENTVLIIGSVKKPLLENEQKKILQYIAQGGNILWLQDPEPDASQQAIEDAFNVSFPGGTLVDNNQEVSRMLQLSHPAIIPVLEYKMHPITAKMQYFTLFTTATAVKSNDNSKWIASDLLISSDTSWSETTGFGKAIIFNQGEDIPGPLSIGLAQQRQIEIDNKKLAQRVVIIGDTDFINNANLGSGANLEFTLNVFNWLSEDDQLISIAPKDAPDLQLDLSATAASIIGIVFLILLPALFFSAGAYIWFKRRKR